MPGWGYFFVGIPGWPAIFCRDAGMVTPPSGASSRGSIVKSLKNIFDHPGIRTRKVYLVGVL